MTDFTLTIRLIEGDTINNGVVRRVYSINPNAKTYWVSSEINKGDYIDEGFTIPEGVTSFDILYNLTRHVTENSKFTGCKHTVYTSTNYHTGNLALEDMEIDIYYMGKLSNYNPVYKPEDSELDYASAMAQGYTSMMLQGFGKFALLGDNQPVVDAEFADMDELSDDLEIECLHILDMETEILNLV